ncbi:AAA family ATPase [Mollicutes bacterium LVI A0039]|nr:AAA family ATPase [Mollicutes bacterium LVI A0039]
MIFEREIKETLLKLLHNYDKPILLLGARQVGKTTIVKEIGESYNNYLYVNFEQNPSVSNLFNDDLIIEELVNQLSLLNDINITTETLLIFDEVQQNPRAITALKYFAETSNYKVIATGSNLGVTMFTDKSSFPVGKVNLVKMYPLSFYEYLRATNKENLASFLRKQVFNESIAMAIHEKLLQEFDNYIELGGYPAVINCYIKNGMHDAIRESKQILEAYRIDISKYAQPNMTSRLQLLYDSISTMLATDNQKFKFTKIDSRGYSNLEYPLHWLIGAEMVMPVYRVETTVLPLKSHIKPNSFKLLLNDVGLLQRQSGYSGLSMRFENDRIYYGLIIENYVGNVINKYVDELYYYQKNTAEIDYILEVNNKPIPLEVKSGNNTKAKSLQVYNQKYDPKLMIKTSRNNLSKVGNLVNVPLYLIDEYIQELIADSQNN